MSCAYNYFNPTLIVNKIRKEKHETEEDLN